LKIIVLSDTHGEYRRLEQVVRQHEDADKFIHLGDGERDVDRLFSMMPQVQGKFCYLNGNCDYGLLYEGMSSLTLPLPYGHQIFAAHGHKFQVKFSTARIVYEARQCQADIVLYGHTHVSDCRYEDGIYIINPGSLGLPRDGKPPSYALLDISEKGVLPNLVWLSGR